MRRLVKRAIDVAVAGTAIVLGSPMIVGTALAVWADVGRPVLFRQRRAGRDGRVFEIHKFRTMREAMDRVGKPLPDHERLTRTGAFLRSASLDELPQLWNVLKGDMSLVGPRPFIADYLPYYSSEQARRHAVVPGITGWAQVHGRNALNWDERIELDVWYVDNWSVLLDLKIVLRTALAVLQRDGVNASAAVTMERFDDVQRAKRARRP